MPRQKVYTSPPCLESLQPPGGKILLNANDHRFTGTWNSSFLTDRFIGSLRNKSVSKTFDFKSEVSWKDALVHVHSTLWTKWSLASEFYPALHLNDSEQQEPGIIAQDVLRELALSIEDLPPKKPYHRGEKS